MDTSQRSVLGGELPAARVQDSDLEKDLTSGRALPPHPKVPFNSLYPRGGETGHNF